MAGNCPRAVEGIFRTGRAWWIPDWANRPRQLARAAYERKISPCDRHNGNAKARVSIVVFECRRFEPEAAYSGIVRYSSGQADNDRWRRSPGRTGQGAMAGSCSGIRTARTLVLAADSIRQRFSVSRPGRFSPRRTRHRRQARGQSGRRQPCADRSACSGPASCGCREASG